MRGALVAMAWVLAEARPAAAQQARPAGVQPVPVVQGTRVRLRAPSLRREPYVGAVERIEGGEITLDTAGVRRRLGFEMGPVLVESYRRVTLRSSAIEQVEVSVGRTTRGSTLKGALIGGLGGALLVGFGQMPEVNPQFKDFLRTAPIGLGVGAVGGAIVGFLLGSERWAPGELPR